MKATDHNRIVKELNAKHKAKVAEIESYWKQEQADLQSQYDVLCEASHKQDERIARLVCVLNIVKDDRRVDPEWFGQMLDAAIEDRMVEVERPEFPFGEFDNGLHWKGA